MVLAMVPRANVSIGYWANSPVASALRPSSKLAAPKSFWYQPLSNPSCVCWKPASAAGVSAYLILLFV